MGWWSLGVFHRPAQLMLGGLAAFAQRGAGIALASNNNNHDEYKFEAMTLHMELMLGESDASGAWLSPWTSW